MKSNFFNSAVMKTSVISKEFRKRYLSDPNNPNVIYAAAIGSPWGEHPERGVFKSVDGGESWKKILYSNFQLYEVKKSWDGYRNSNTNSAVSPNAPG